MTDTTANDPDSPLEPPGNEADQGILILNRDLFFGVRLREALLADGWRPQILPTATALAQTIETGPPPALVIVDMAARPDWKLITAVASQTEPPTPVLAFGPHKDVEGFRAAKAGGATRVVANGDFHRDVTGFVRRYARRPEEPVTGTGRTPSQTNVAENPDS